MKTRGLSKAATLPANIGSLRQPRLVSGITGLTGVSAYLEPVESTLKLPNCFFAVTNQAMSATKRPRTGEPAAAIQFWPDHIRVKVAGKTAAEMITPIIK